MNVAARVGATALAGVLLAGCGASNTPSSSGSKDAPAASPTASETVPPATGVAMKGTGYTYHLPEGWTDITAALKRSAPAIDTGGRATPFTPPFTSNLTVTTTANGRSSPPTDADLTALKAKLKTIFKSFAPNLEAKPDTTVDGAPAVHVEAQATQGSSTYLFVQYLIVHGGRNYQITFALPRDTSPKESSELIDPVLASWKFK